MKGDSAGMQKIISKIFIDDLIYIAAEDDEFVDAVVAVGLEDVPQQRLTAHLNHGLVPQMGLLGQERPETSIQNNCFHEITYSAVNPLEGSH